MNWSTLLSAKRVKELSGQSHTTAKPGTDTRSEHERDYGRAVFCTPVRRLQDKAQVFPREPNDSVRTRLTHSLEVSTLCRSLVAGLREFLHQNGVAEDGVRSIEAIAATSGLLHDIGNPPFGHAGERAIAEWYLAKKKDDAAIDLLSKNDTPRSSDFENFDGNPQTVRLVTRLQLLADHYGLNLCAGTVAALIKYTACSTEIDSNIHARSKIGYFQSERNIVDLVRDATGIGASRHPLVFLVEAADDMVYSTVDIEDAVKKGLFDWSVVKAKISEVDDSLPADVEAYIGQFNWTGLSRSARDEALVQFLRTKLIYLHVEAVVTVFRDRYEEIMRGEYDGELLCEGRSSQLLDACGKLAKENIYSNREVMLAELEGRAAIQGLLDDLWDGVSNNQRTDRKSFSYKIYHAISSNYRSVFEKAVTDPTLSPEQRTYHQLQLVTDYVCGMTDSYVIEMFRKLRAGR